MNKIDEIVSNCSARVVEYIRDTHMVDLKEVESMIGLHFRAAFEAFLRPEDQAITDEMERYIREQASRNVSRERRVWLNDKIRALSEKRKRIRRAIAEAEIYKEFYHLKHFIKERFGEGVLEEFYKNEPEKPRTSRIDSSATRIDTDNPDRFY